MVRRLTYVLGATALVVGAAGVSPAIAGPPLLCHPFDIGDAASLPWDGRAGWSSLRADYDVSKLAADTAALLTPETPVVVRMETLRRAAIYGGRDERAARELLSTLSDRMTTGGGKDAFVLLDAAYFIEATRQMSLIGESGTASDRAARARAVIGDRDGYALVKQAVVLRPDDPAIAFAAALVAADKDRAAYLAHARRARAGVKRDALLARNIDRVQ